MVDYYLWMTLAIHGAGDNPQAQHAEAAEEFEDAANDQDSQDHDDPVGDDVEGPHCRFPVSI